MAQQHDRDILAVEGNARHRNEINDSGGLLGKRVRFITIDDSSRSYLAVMAVKRLIEHDKVSAILGEVISSRTHAAAPLPTAKSCR